MVGIHRKPINNTHEIAAIYFSFVLGGCSCLNETEAARGLGLSHKEVFGLGLPGLVRHPANWPVSSSLNDLLRVSRNVSVPKTKTAK